MNRNDVLGRLEAARDAARDQVVPAAEDAVHAAAERVAPLVQQAVDLGGPYVERASAAAAPYVEKVTPYVEKVTPYVQDAADRVGPYAHSARVKGAAAAAAAAETLGPRIDDARDRLNDDLLPRLSTALSGVAAGAAASPVAVEARRRGQATVAAMKGQVELPTVKPKRRGRRFARFALFAGLAALVAVVVKKRFATDDPGWQSAVRPAPTAATAPSAASADDDGVVVEPAPEAVQPESADVELAEASRTSEEAFAEEVAAEPTDASSTGSSDGRVGEPENHGVSDAAFDEITGDAPVDDTASETGKSYGEGSYVGTEPPEGFTIKGNENSMKYHLPDGAGYGRTIAEVWFDSEEAAQAAGFVRAQR